MALNLLALVAFKYANFVADNLDVVLGVLGLPLIKLQPVHLPIGISFYTFQAMSYVVDVYRGEARPQRNPLKVGLYLSLFPQLIAGPIVRYTEVVAEIDEREESLSSFSDRVARFTVGLAKKMVIANPMGQRADEIFALSTRDLSSEIA